LYNCKREKRRRGKEKKRRQTKKRREEPIKEPIKVIVSRKPQTELREAAGPTTRNSKK